MTLQYLIVIRFVYFVSLSLQYDNEPAHVPEKHAEGIRKITANNLANKNTELTVLPLFWPVNCIKMGGVALRVASKSV